VTTLHNGVSSCVIHNVNPGPVSYLNPVEEKTLATFLKHCTEVGYGKTRKEVLAIVEGVTHDKNVLKGTKINRVVEEFIGRQGDLSLRKGDIAEWMLLTQKPCSIISTCYEMLLERTD